MLWKCRQNLHQVCSHYVPYQLLHECPSKNYLFVEFPEHLSISKKYYIETKLPLVENYLSKGGREQKRHLRISRTTCPSIRGRIYVANKNPIYRRATSLMGWGTLLLWPYLVVSSSCISIRPVYSTSSVT